MICCDWLSYSPPRSFLDFWQGKGYACCHITVAGPNFADANVSFPRQRDSYGCAYYAVLTVVELMESFARSDTRRVVKFTFAPKLYDLNHYCAIRQQLFNEIMYYDNGPKYLRDNLPLLNYLKQGMGSVFFASLTYEFTSRHFCRARRQINVRLQIRKIWMKVVRACLMCFLLPVRFRCDQIILMLELWRYAI